MEAATVLHMPEREEEADIHPLTSLISEAREHGAHTNRQVAEWVLDNGFDWVSMSQEERVAVLSRAMRTWPRGSQDQRHKELEGTWAHQEGDTEPTMRLTAAGDIWSVEWPDVNFKQTRDLTLADLETLALRYKMRAVEMIARVRWFAELKKLMEVHSVRTAGGLEKKGVKLPSVKVGAGE